MVHSFSLSNVGSCRYPIIRSNTNNSEVSLTITTPRKREPHSSFTFLVGAGNVLSIAAAAVERRSVNRALQAWDVEAGASVGLEARMGVLAHSKFSLFFSLIFRLGISLPLHVSRLRPEWSS